MIKIYAGNIRGGKTYHCMASDYLPTIKRNVNAKNPRHIYTNIKGVLEDDQLMATAAFCGCSCAEVAEWVHVVPNVWFLNVWDHGLENALLIIDEAHNVWCSREWKSFTAEGREWIAESGQYLVDIVCISQTSSSIEKWVKDRAEVIYTVRKLSILGLPKYYSVSGRTTFATTNDLKTTWHKYNPAVYACYKSFQADPSQYAAADSSSIFGGLFKFGFATVAILFCYFAYKVFFVTPETEAAPSTLPASVTKTFSPSPASVPQSYIWITGVFYQVGKRPYVSLMLADGRQVTADFLDLDFRASVDGTLMLDGSLYRVGSALRIDSALLDLVPPSNNTHANASSPAGLFSSVNAMGGIND